ncbi:MAG: glycosyltransferase involved in cell wall biosynthesis [Planctomycetota bacterium]|jgi:glycosyltransferase involved in cell wall biosynthesis
MITYNHKRWIREAIESVLAQEFQDFEIVVGDDVSTDGTTEIVAEYAARDPRVRLLPSDKNLGGRKNFARTYSACRGEFINALDGDDYFLDPQKLKLQVELLDRNPDLVGVFAGSQEVEEDGTPIGEGKHPRPPKARYTILDFARYCLSDSAAMMTRRAVFGELPELFYSPPQGDWPLHILNAMHGDFGYIESVFTAYRIHPDGVWNKKSLVEKVAANLEVQRQFLIHLPADTVRQIRPVIARSVLGQIKPIARQGECEAAKILLDWLGEHCKGMLPQRKIRKARLRLHLARLRARWA